jgi:hypothetical protein
METELSGPLESSNFITENESERFWDLANEACHHKI